MIITIARQCGSGGHEIGKELASRLGMELYDRKKLEKELIRVVYAPILLTCKVGVEKRFNDELTAIATVAEEDVQVVGKQLDQSMVGQFAKNVQTAIQERAGKFKSI